MAYKNITRGKVNHCVSVAYYMADQAPRYRLNPTEMFIIGLLHDIGYLVAHSGHEKHGKNILSDLGMHKRILFSIEHHGDRLSEVEEKYGSLMKRHRALLLLVEGDMQVNHLGEFVGFEKRLEDIHNRHGDNEHYFICKDNVEYIRNLWKEMGWENIAYDGGNE